jgi:predicted LPLAT superfamily acyltransferase
MNTPATPATAWASRQERGSALLVRFMVWLALSLGRPVSRLLMYPIAGYFIAFSPVARSASKDFLTRALGRPARFGDFARHIWTFSSVVLDRVFLLAGRTRDYRIEMVGFECIEATLAQHRGCLLLGSHLGSFEVMRAMADACPVRIRPLMYRANGGTLAGLFEHLNPRLAADVIDIGSTGAMLEVYESVARGEVVGILADRTPSDQKYLAADFFGAPARFPTGPFILAAVAAAPTFLFFGIRVGRRHYRLHLEPFADKIVLSRTDRHDELRHWIEQYAARLVAHCRKYPYNWFNFFDFWEGSDGGTATVRADAGDSRAAAAPAGPGRTTAVSG